MPKTKKPPPELVTLDFHEHDTVAALEYLRALTESGLIAGIVYGAVSKRGSRPLFGATGRLATNNVEACGVAAILEDQLTQEYLACAQGK